MVFLGTLINKDGNRPDPAKVEAVASAPRPVDKHTVRAFYGLASYYRRWVANFASIARPLSELLKKDAPFDWGPPQEEAFQKLKAALCSSPILTRPDFSRPFELKTDWCPHAVAAILSQRDEENRKRVIAYSSRERRLGTPQLRGRSWRWCTALPLFGPTCGTTPSKSTPTTLPCAGPCPPPTTRAGWPSGDCCCKAT